MNFTLIHGVYFILHFSFQSESALVSFKVGSKNYVGLIFELI